MPTVVNTVGSPSSSIVFNLTSVSGIDASINTSSLSEVAVSEIHSLIQRLELEDKDGGDGGDSDIEGEEVRCHAIRKSFESEPDVEDAIQGEEFGAEVGGPKRSRMLKLTATGSTEIIGEVAEDGGSSGNNPVQLQLPKRETNWTPPAVILDKGEVPFERVVNLGGWDEYYFLPKFNKSGRYMGHFLPTGATPVPKNN